ncbi:MAG TPA: TonB-dependent receptor, partial [Erythrobacter sp.]|nr:TonB-dependent receptor [Erythrobacter sp.]
MPSEQGNTVIVNILRAGAGATALAAATVFAVSPAQAQQAGIEIAVVDAAGAPVADAEVIITNPAIGLSRTVRTNARGIAQVDGLTTAGEYLVSAPASDRYAALAAQPVELRANFARSVILQLAAAESAGIVVTASRAITGLNTSNAEISASLGREQLAALPVEGRDVIGALVRLPNVVASTGFFPEAPSISINGSNGLDTIYLIDGLDNNENFLGGIRFPVPLGFTREVTVLANSYSAAYGRTANGIVNYTTPSGSNAFTGEVYSLVRPGRPLDSRSPFPRRDLSGNPVGESFERYQAGFAVGGPLQRDKTFFYANYEYTRDRNTQVVDAPALGIVDTVTGNNTFHLASLRLDHRLTDDWTLGLRANVGRV